MKRYQKRKESKITLKTHHLHHPIHKDELTLVQGGMTSYQPTRHLLRKEGNKR